MIEWTWMSVGRPVSAREVYSEAARAFPDEPEALVADAGNVEVGVTEHVRILAGTGWRPC